MALLVIVKGQNGQFAFPARALAAFERAGRTARGRACSRPFRAQSVILASAAALIRGHPGWHLSRSDAVMERMAKMGFDVPAVQHALEGDERNEFTTTYKLLTMEKQRGEPRKDRL
eukprot:18776-Prorocentrum_minimum.AAC.4